MEEFPEKAELRRVQREQERERRRIRDRERRQSMTQEQRERHLARRRKNYQLRRQRAANNNNATFIPHHPLEGEASTSNDHPRLVSYSISDYGVLHNDLPHHHLLNSQARHETSSLGTHNMDGSRVHLEALTYKPTNLPRRLRLNHIRRLARNSIHPIADDTQTGIHQVVADLIPHGVASANGSTQKSLRLNRVKQLARLPNSPSKESLAQNLNGTVLEGANIPCPKTYGDEFKCC